MKVAVIVAMDRERALLQEALQAKGPARRLCGEAGGNEVLLLHSGIGKVNSAALTARLLDAEKPDLVLSSGVAGGVDAKVRRRDFVASRRLCYHDVWCGEGNVWGQVQGCPAEFAGDGASLETLCRVSAQLLPAGGPRLHTGLICTGDRFVTEAEDLAAIKGRFPDCLAIDMESAAIAQVCHQAGVPFLALRIISDSVAHETSHETQYADFWEEAPERSAALVGAFLAAL